MNMDCQQVAETLPWLLNGTLAAPEQAALKSHLAQCPKCEREWQDTLFAAAVYQQHITADSLVDYAFNRPLLAQEREQIERHVATCQACAAELELVRESHRLHNEESPPLLATAEIKPFAPAKSVDKGTGIAGPALSAVRAWKFATLAAGIAGICALGGLLWNQQTHRSELAHLGEKQRVLTDRLASLEAEAQQLRNAQKNPTVTPSVIPTITPSVTAEQLKNEIARLEAQVKNLSSPGINTPVIEILPDQMTQRSGGKEPRQIELPRSARVITLILNSQTEAKDAMLEILDSKNKTIWNADGLIRHSTGDYTITLPADLLPPGTYTINVYGKTAGKREKVESWQMRTSRSTSRTAKPR